MITNTLSQNIYNKLINGKIINKHRYIIKSNELKENPLYTEVFNNINEYKELYQRINFNLTHKNNCFFYIRELTKNEANEVTIKIQALLIIIGRIVTEQGYLFDILTDYCAGIKPEILIESATEERYLDILQTCKLCKSRGIKEEIENNLITRELMFKNSKGNYVFTDSGLAFFEELSSASGLPT